MIIWAPSGVVGKHFYYDDQKSLKVKIPRGMSALPPKADIAAAQTNVRFVPKADIASRGIVYVDECRNRCFRSMYEAGELIAFRVPW